MPSFTATKARRNSRLLRGCNDGDGNVYITERPRRQRNSPLFREDNSSLTLGRDGKYYFCFILPEAKSDSLPDALVHQALSIAQKVERTILKQKGHKRLEGKK